MTSGQEYSFRTKTGTCIITSEQIILKREGIRGTAAKRIHGDNIKRSLSMYAVIGTLAIALGTWMFTTRDYFPGAILFALGILLLWNVFASRSNSAASVIERAAIVAVEAHSPRPPLTRGYFMLRFMENGKERKRLIMLPGTLSGGRQEYQRAFLAMQQAGLLGVTQGDAAKPSA